MKYDINTIIANILSGNATSEEQIEFSLWLSESKVNQEEYRAIKEYWDAELVVTYNLDPTKGLKGLLLEVNKKQRKKNLTKRLKTYFPIAASVLILIVGIYIYSLIALDYKPNEYTYFSSNGRAEIMLMDSTKVTLDKNSKLVYIDDYKNNRRLAKLDGKAFFEVAKDQKRKFSIDCDGASINVLGTSFDIDMHNREYLKTTLVEGSIAFEVDGKELILKPDQQLIYSRSNKDTQVNEVDSEAVVAWSAGLRIYNSVEFGLVIKELEEVYNTKIVIAQSASKKLHSKVSGTFKEEQTLAELLDIISKSFAFRYKVKDNTYHIY